jgi:hypothetical protein
MTTKTSKRKNTKGKDKSSGTNLGPMVRVTLVIPETVDKTIELCKALEGRQKNEIVTEALTHYLRNKGYQPDKLPTKPQY